MRESYTYQLEPNYTLRRENTKTKTLGIFDFNVLRVAENLECPINFYMSIYFFDIQDFLQKEYPEKYEYVKKMRDYFGNFGLKDVEVIQKAEEEGFNWIEIVEAFIKTPFGKEILCNMIFMTFLILKRINNI